jgi:Zn-finger nucleic acid-binding protein
MNCPIDESVLVMSERNGIEIDYCPQCRGVWLDRGELDKIIDRAGDDQRPSVANQSAYPQRPDSRQDFTQQPYPPKRRKENWLSELFD